MIRSMMQTYVTGSAEAVALYQKAFDAPLISEYKHEDGSYYHSELVVYGQVWRCRSGWEVRRVFPAIPCSSVFILKKRREPVWRKPMRH